jgi:small subunit ribosomal protein S4
MAVLHRQHKNYSKPRKAFDSTRIAAENVIKEKYGLKNKREIWKAEAIVKKLREQAKSLITSPAAEQNKFISRLVGKGFLKKNSQIDDVLELKVENILDRRFQTIVLQKGLAKTSKGARQMIVHKHVFLGNHIVNIPSYSVNLEEEEIIKLKPKSEEIKSESKENKNA